MLTVTMGFGTNNTGNSIEMLADVGIGPAGSEQVLLENLHYSHDNSHSTYVPEGMGPYPVDIPAGTRIAMRHQRSDVSNSNDDPRPSIQVFG